jgi:hypothetical protein
MIAEAEENEEMDRAKKGLVEISYEFDNSLSKIEKLLRLQTSNLMDASISTYFEEILNESKDAFRSNNFQRLESTILPQFEYAFQIFLKSYLKSTFLTASTEKSSPSSGSKIIDI